MLRATVLGALSALCGSVIASGIRGVNLAGWLTLEPFITPSLFENLDPEAPDSPFKSAPNADYGLGQKVGVEIAQSMLRNHWETFYSEEDFKQIAALGFTHVKIPMGHWAFKNSDPNIYVSGQTEYLSKALQWAADHDLKLWVSLDNYPEADYNSSEILTARPSNIEETIEVIANLITKYGTGDDDSQNVEAIELPWIPPQVESNQQVIQFYESVLREVRSRSNINVVLKEVPSIVPLMNTMNNQINQQYDREGDIFYTSREYPALSRPFAKTSIYQRIQEACRISKMHQEAASLNSVIGAFSAAMDDCAKWYNGFGVGRSYNGTYGGGGIQSPIGSCEMRNDPSRWTEEEFLDTSRYLEGQLSAWNQLGGWFFWTYKTESEFQWDYHRLAQRNLVPDFNSSLINICL
uniref:ARAD1D41558p n=1 Tax=Blastobotrys adeninivorans TaxID=409370 RepID=A0A060TCF5_BLAAD